MAEYVLRLDADLAIVLRDVVERHYVATRWKARPGAPPPDEVLWMRKAFVKGAAIEAVVSNGVLARLTIAIRWCGEQNQLGPQSTVWLERLRTAVTAAENTPT